jgi:EAL domain-containing protein (putative c-di-GMP-specific phosphodiesterase class I)
LVEGGPALPAPDREHATFDRALDSIWMAYQPIVRAETGSLFGYEALLRSDEPTLADPGAFLDAAERLGRLHDVGRVVRERASRPMLTHERDTILELGCDLLQGYLLGRPGRPFPETGR